MPLAFEPGAIERDVEMAFLQPFVWLTLGCPAPAIPYDHGAAAIFAFRNVALEVEVLHRMIFGAHRKTLLADDHAGTLGDRPALQRAAEFQAQVVVHATRVVLLHDELPALAFATGRLGFARARKIAFALVFLERVAARGLTFGFGAGCHRLSQIRTIARSASRRVSMPAGRAPPRANFRPVRYSAANSSPHQTIGRSSATAMRD